LPVGLSRPSFPDAPRGDVTIPRATTAKRTGKNDPLLFNEKDTERRFPAMANATSKTASAAGNEMYASGEFKPVVEKCEGCDRIIAVESDRYCRVYVEPAAKWKLGLCNFASHVKPELTIAKIKINPLKASKRASGKKK
jgi:hypothetical protein